MPAIPDGSESSVAGHKGCGRRSDGPWCARDLLAHRRHGRRPSSNPEGPRPGPRLVASRHLGTPVEQNRCGRPWTVGEPARPVPLVALNDHHWLGTVGEELIPLVTRSVRLAKAKVAGSKPVFRSKSPGFHALGGSGLFHGRRLSWRRRPFTTVAGSSGSSRRTGPLADRSDAIPWQSGTRMPRSISIGCTGCPSGTP